MNQKEVRPFVDTLRELRGGATQDELAQQLNALVCGVLETGRPGSITLTIKVRPVGKDQVHVVEIEDEVKVKSPVPVKPSTLFFTTDQNNLQRNDPRQRSLELKDAKKAEPAQVEQRANA